MFICNFLEELVEEWYLYNGYVLLKRNEKVEKRKKGGYKSELDLLFYDPKNEEIIIIECSTDASDIKKLKDKLKDKFKVLEDYIRKNKIEGISYKEEEIRKIFIHKTAKGRRESFDFCEYINFYDLLKSIYEKLKCKNPTSEAIDEKFILLKMIQEIVYVLE